MAMTREGDALPVVEVLPALREALAAGNRALLEAPPGAGKTTRVPLALLDAEWLAGRRIVMLEPRRIAARSAATFMAAQLGEPVGETVGYRIRFEVRVSARTRIEVVTEGILTRMIQDDPELAGIGLLIFDEFHERHLQGDLGLALSLDLQEGLRPDLRLLLMSATLDGSRLAAFLDAPELRSEGRSYPVRIEYRSPAREESATALLARTVDEALRSEPGDLLVFLPGRREIEQAQRMLAERLGDAVELLALHGELPVEQQATVLRDHDPQRRRVVLATNVAESSLTLPGVRVVIDSGLAREPRFDPNSGFSRLDTVRISQASADQRAGRAGRLAPGACFRLWSAEQRLDSQRRPEISQVDLSGLLLDMAAWGSSDLRFPDPLPAGAVAAARDLLRDLDALDADGRINAKGRRMLALGAHPRLAAMLVDVKEADRALACDLAALIEARDPLGTRSDDLSAAWRALAAFRQRKGGGGSRAALSAIDRAAAQWRRRLRCNQNPGDEVSAQHLGALLARAFPDRIAHQDGSDPLRYALSGGRRARLHPESALRGHPWLVVAELRDDRDAALVQRVLPVSEDDLRRDFANHFVDEEVVRWDATRGALSAGREQRFGRIVLLRSQGGDIDPEHAARALAQAAAGDDWQRLPWDDATAQLLERLRCLRECMPEWRLPALDEASLKASVGDWLLPMFRGKRRLDALSAEELREALWLHLANAGVDPSLRRRLDALLPVRLEVPSGLRAPIHYMAGEAPVLSVKLQALFGLAETPRVAEGRVPLTLHLLSPAGRPLQVTQDLASFWNGAYAEVRKEMKGRYPRHPWPEDPWNAPPSHRAKPRGSR